MLDEELLHGSIAAAAAAETQAFSSINPEEEKILSTVGGASGDGERIKTFYNKCVFKVSFQETKNLGAKIIYHKLNISVQLDFRCQFITVLFKDTLFYY